MSLNPHQISLSTKIRTTIHRDDPLHYVSNIEIDNYDSEGCRPRS